MFFFTIEVIELHEKSQKPKPFHSLLICPPIFPRWQPSIIYFHVTSLPFYLCRRWSKANDNVIILLLQNIYMYTIVTLKVVYDHVRKCRKLPLCYLLYKSI